MPRPIPTPVVHFTRVEHVADIIARGLVSDNEAQAEGLLTVEIGNVGIKERRRRRTVPRPPHGTVADYVPFYFAPRSPMMYSIHCGNVPTYSHGCDRLVYLASTVERLISLGLDVLLTDRNAVLDFADFVDADADVPDDFIDWDLMKAQYWNNTPDRPDRKERRMAECLVRPRVPWEAFESVVARSAPVAREVEAQTAAAASSPSVDVRPQWYF